jgi:hypothetical protein
LVLTILLFTVLVLTVFIFAVFPFFVFGCFGFAVVFFVGIKSPEINFNKLTENFDYSQGNILGEVYFLQYLDNSEENIDIILRPQRRFAWGRQVKCRRGYPANA